MTGCPDPGSCPVAPYPLLAAAPRHTIKAGSVWARAHDSTWGYDEPNPGVGNTRFAPFAAAGGAMVPTMYLAGDETGSLQPSSLWRGSMVHEIEASRWLSSRPRIRFLLKAERALSAMSCLGAS